MKVTDLQKTFKITLEATEDELKDILDTLKQYNGYGAIEDLEKILEEAIREESEEE